MAKRRNLKKEKADRNRAYARQFRRQPSRSSSSRSRRFYGQDRKQEDDQSEGAAQS